MRAIYILLLAAILLITANATADVDHPKLLDVASLDMPVLSPAMLPQEGDSTVNRFLRTGDKEKDRSEDDEERSILPAASSIDSINNAAYAWVREIYNHPLMVKFESIMNKIQSKFRSLIGKRQSK